MIRKLWPTTPRKKLIWTVIPVCAFMTLLTKEVLADYDAELSLIFTFGNTLVSLLLFIAVTRKWPVSNSIDTAFFILALIYFSAAFSLLLAADPSPWYAYKQSGIMPYRMPISRAINLIPFGTIIGHFHDYGTPLYAVKEIIGNIIVLSPLCFFLLYFKQMTIKKAFYVIFCCSLSVELLQLLSDLLLFQQRAVDIDDVILNTSGTVLGIASYQLYRWLASQLKRFTQKGINERTNDKRL